ncbi:hypothetical protein KC338_g283 [Hortaea werneckii]|nr:hypothetical protein KC338_g283 [Hortaea werneckii]
MAGEEKRLSAFDTAVTRRFQQPEDVWTAKAVSRHSHQRRAEGLLTFEALPITHEQSSIESETTHDPRDG